MQRQFVLASLLLAGLPLAAQQATPPADTQANPQSGAPGGAPPAPSQSAGSQPAAPTALALSSVKSELVGKLDTKSAKTGDAVVVKTSEKVTTAHGTVIPKGTKLVGKVTLVSPRSEASHNAEVAIQFDHAELKDGGNVPIQSVIRSVAPADSETGATDPAAALPAGSTAPQPPSAGSSGGGAAMGASGSPQTSQPPTQPQTAASGPPASPAAVGAPAPGTVVATKGNITIRTTAVPGVLLAGNSSGLPFSNASGLLLGANEDVQLTGGTRMVLGVADTSPAGR